MSIIYDMVSNEFTGDPQQPETAGISVQQDLSYQTELQLQLVESTAVKHALPADIALQAFLKAGN